MKSFPFWPAKIINPPTLNKETATAKGLQKKKPSTHKKAQHYVFFFGSKNHAWILDENIVPHSEEMLSKVTKKKSVSYTKAIEEIIDASSSIVPKPVKEDSDEDESKPDLNLEKITETPSVKDDELLTKSSTTRAVKRKPKQKVKGEKTKKSPSKRKSTEGEDSDEESCPTRKLSRMSDDFSALISNTPPNLSYSRVAVIRPLDDRTMVSREYFDLPPEPPIDFSRATAVMRSRNVAPTSKKIGFIGLGMMGQRIVKNLLDSGHDVSVWNRTPNKCCQFTEVGAHRCYTPYDIVLCCDIIFCCVSGPEASKSLVFENWGILQGLEKCEPGTKGYVEMSCIDPITSQEIAEAITYKGGKYLEAPISGSRSLAEEGTLLILGAGDRELFNNCDTCFYAISRHAYYLSCDVGNASKMNLIINTLIGTSFAALGETMALVERCNLSKNNFLELLDLNTLNCPLIAEKGQAILASNYLTNMSLKYQQKDLSLALTLSDKHDQPMILGSAANELFKHAKQLRYTDHDVSAVFFGAKY
ncbi:putative oxidoreductase GLYR1 homolog [Trichonephila inaurata madagascariensis]|uniref:Cytokine-like nuclear factor N-PAC n=1 Tax=Trichonephila inaurata madagascariensis TaxID=2747483 RepID=A0A8X7C7D0_9ARAC|nr:putative oxidoreductase GLYR1 homolog [Trichonephila inaurata madagascariensis]